MARSPARLARIAAHVAAGQSHAELGGVAPIGPEPERDFIGYGGSPPDPKWPGGATVALNFVINVEEGSEPSVADGDGATTTGLVEPSAGRTALPGRDLGAESMFEYGSRAGFWRLVNLFEARHAPVTLFACALALERNPALADKVREGVAAGTMDVCCHGYRWEEHYKLEAEEESERIAAAVASLQRTTGAPPDGWYCRYGPSINTRRLVLEHGGFLYDSDSYNDDLPYWQPVEGLPPQLVVPYSLTNNDGKFTAGGVGTSDDFFAFCKDAIDQLREEASMPGGVGRMMSVGLHQRLMGHPARARAVGMLLDYAAACPDVWVTTRKAIALHWRERFPVESSVRAAPAAASSSGPGGSAAGGSGVSKFAQMETQAERNQDGSGAQELSDDDDNEDAEDETGQEAAIRAFQEAEGYDAKSFSAWESHQDEIAVKLSLDVVEITPLDRSGIAGTEDLPPGFGALCRCDLNEVVANPQAFEAVR